MSTEIHVTLRIEELCQRTRLSHEEIIEIVHQEIIHPHDIGADTWQFDLRAASLAARAGRLHRDLELDWHGVALALELLDELEALRRENHLLRQRLQRFEDFS